MQKKQNKNLYEEQSQSLLCTKALRFSEGLFAKYGVFKRVLHYPSLVYLRLFVPEMFHYGQNTTVHQYTTRELNESEEYTYNYIFNLDINSFFPRFIVERYAAVFGAIKKGEKGALKQIKEGEQSRALKQGVHRTFSERILKQMSLWGFKPLGAEEESTPSREMGEAVIHRHESEEKVIDLIRGSKKDDVQNSARGEAANVARTHALRAGGSDTVGRMPQGASSPPITHIEKSGTTVRREKSESIVNTREMIMNSISGKDISRKLMNTDDFTGSIKKVVRTVVEDRMGSVFGELMKKTELEKYRRGL